MNNKSKSFRLGGYSVLATAIVIAIAIAANVIVSLIPEKYTSFDTTQSEMFTIGEVSEGVLAKLEDDIEILWFVAEGDEDDGVEMLLKDYLAKSDKLTLKKIDPDTNPALVNNYTSNVTPNSLVVICGDRTRYVDYYDIYTVIYDEMSYYTGNYDVNFSGENAITGAINYVTNDNLPKVYAMTGHGEAALTTNYRAAVKNANMDVLDFSFLKEAEIPGDAGAVIINCPKSDLTPSDVEKLTAYLKQGGSLLLITGPQNGNGGKAFENINKLMMQYGVYAADGVVVDPNANYYVPDNPTMLVPEIISGEITSDLKYGNYIVCTPFAHGIMTPGLENNTTVLVNKLLKTSNKAYSKLAAENMTTYEKQEGDIDGGFSIGVQVVDAINEDQKIYGKIVWYTSEYLMDEELSSQVAGANQTLFMNSVAYLCDVQESGVFISPKSLAEEKLVMTGSQANIMRVIFMIAIPLVYLLAGIVVWVRRRHR